MGALIHAIRVYFPTARATAAAGCTSSPPAQPYAHLVFVPTARATTAAGCTSNTTPVQPSPDAMYSATTAPVAATPSMLPGLGIVSVYVLAGVCWITMGHIQITA